MVALQSTRTSPTISSEIRALAKEFLPPTEIDASQLAGPIYVTSSPLGGYAISPNGERLSQSEFAQKYALALTSIARLAKRIIEDVPSTSSLNSLIAKGVKAPCDSTSKAKTAIDPTLCSSLQERHENLIRTEIVRLANSGLQDPELQLRAANLALMCIRQAKADFDFQDLINSPRSELLESYRNMMTGARSKAGSDVLRVLNVFIEIAINTTGIVPDLVVGSDYDGYLSLFPESRAESGGIWKAGEKTNVLVNEIDKICGFRLSHRLVMTEYAGGNIELARTAQDCYDIAADSSPLFGDTHLFMEGLKQNACEHFILTANSAAMVSTKLAREGLSGFHDGVIGMRSDFTYSSKPAFLLSDLLMRPAPVIYLFGDDDNRSLWQHIKNGPSNDGYWLPDLMFFAAREPDAIHNFRIAPELERLRIPFVKNTFIPQTNEGMIGIRTFVEEYKKIRQRLKKL